jgi:hypothetical protein
MYVDQRKKEIEEMTNTATTTHHFEATNSDGETFEFDRTFANFDEQAEFFQFARTAQEHGFTFRFTGSTTNES